MAETHFSGPHRLKACVRVRRTTAHHLTGLDVDGHPRLGRDESNNTCNTRCIIQQDDIGKCERSSRYVKDAQVTANKHRKGCGQR